MRLFLVRHAHAKDRGPGGRGLYRQLTAAGKQRSLELVDLLADGEVRRVVSSRATRCVQTIQPLADRLEISVEEHDDLVEGSAINDVMALLEELGTNSVVCSHGDVIPGVIEWVGSQGAQVTGRGCQKGSIWVLDHDGTNWVHARYVQPAKTSV